MSSGGQILGGIVGSVTGFIVSGGSLMGAAYGAQIGMMAGGIIDPPKGPNINGPRLSDLSVQTSTYGAFISRDYGTIAQSGNIFWLQGDALTEVQTETEGGGKGGPISTNTSWSYFATFAVGLCEGPIDGIRKIWIGPDLFYDASDTNTGATGSSSGFTLYHGTDTQLADPLIQADKGAANTPAYRGLAYIVFHNLALAKYSNSLLGAQVKVEIVQSGTLSRPLPTYILDSTNGYGGLQPIYDNKTGILVYNTIWRTLHFYDLFNGVELFTVDTGADVWSIQAGAPGTIWAWGQYDFYVYDVVSGARIATIARPGASDTTGKYNPRGNSFLVTQDGNLIKYTLAGKIPIAYEIIYSAGGAIIWQAMEITKRGYVVLYSDASKKIVILRPGFSFSTYDSYSISTSYDVSAGGNGTWTHTSTYDPVRDKVYICNSSGTFIITVDTSGFIPVITEHALSTVGVWPLYHKQSDTLICYSTGPYPTIELRDPESLALLDSFGNDSTFWATSYMDAWPIEVDGWADKFIAWGPKVAIVQFDRRITPLSISLSTVVQAECLTSALLTSSDIDVTDLTDIVRGYKIASQGAIRGALDPLRGAWPFDVVQSGYKIKFKKRGSASVITIPSSDLDARAAGDAPGISITDTREMDLVLPRKVNVKYLDVIREYDVNEQSEERLNTDAVNEQTVDLAIVFNANEAKQKAEMLLYLYWMERYDISFKLPGTYAQLEPGDVITITASNATYELRLTRTNTLPDGRMECQAKYSSAALYVPAALGSEGQSVGSVIPVISPSVYKLLDIPLMSDDTDTAGFPVAMSSYQSGWPGGVLYRSDDEGTTWLDVKAFSPGQIMGVAVNTLSTHTGTVLDKASTLTVRVYAGELSSVTEAQMFVGQNWFAYGVHGRWEIIAAQNCVLQVDGTYILSDFLRGQNGTEWATGVHVAGDDLIYLSTATLEFISVNSSTINSPRLYRGITSGLTLDSDLDYPFTYAAVNLECLSPVHLTGDRNPSSNDWSLTWIRRSRYYGWRDLVDAPLGESSESYEIDVYSSGTYATVKRTLTSATPSVTYSSANQVTDFGSNQSTLYLKIYQLSSIAGRGYALTQSITR